VLVWPSFPFVEYRHFDGITSFPQRREGHDDVFTKHPRIIKSGNGDHAQASAL